MFLLKNYVHPPGATLHKYPLASETAILRDFRSPVWSSLPFEKQFTSGKILRLLA